MGMFKGLKTSHLYTTKHAVTDGAGRLIQYDAFKTMRYGDGNFTSVDVTHVKNSLQCAIVLILLHQ